MRVWLTALVCLWGLTDGSRAEVTGQVPSSFHDTSSPAAAAGDTPRARFRAGVELVALNVVVTDAADAYVTGLTPGDFAVYEDGVRQDLAFFGSADVPLDLAILLDTSASMGGRLQIAQQAAVGLVSTLREGDRVTVIDIKDTTTILFPLDGDVEAARQAISSATAGGGTALYNGTYLALREMTRLSWRNGDVRRQAVVLLSDGADTSSLLSYDDVMDVARRSGIAVYTVSLESRLAAAARPRSDYSMRALAQETGGRAFFPDEVTDLPEIYAAIGKELATQYALGYISNNPKADGTYRRVVVSVPGGPNLRTRTRAGYVSASAGSLAR